MKSLFYVFFIIVIGSTLFLSGCELITNKPDTNRPPPPGNDLIVSEVFTLSPDKYYDFSWVEVYNPTRRYFQWFYQQYPIVGVVVGDNGSCYYTDDDGETWSHILPPAGFENRPFNDVSFSVEFIISSIALFICSFVAEESSLSTVSLFFNIS